MAVRIFWFIFLLGFDVMFGIGLWQIIVKADGIGKIIGIIAVCLCIFVLTFFAIPAVVFQKDSDKQGKSKK